MRETFPLALPPSLLGLCWRATVLRSSGSMQGRGRKRLVGRVGVVKVRIHKLSNTYNGHGSPRLSFSIRIRIQIQHSHSHSHSALTVSIHTHKHTLTHTWHIYTHSQHIYSHSLPLSTHSIHTPHSLRTHTLCKIHIQHLNSILGHTLRVANGQQSPVCPCQPLPLPPSCHAPFFSVFVQPFLPVVTKN